MATFTTFCFGTGESQAMAKKNIISQFSEACSSDFSVYDGPGLLGKKVGPNTDAATRGVIDWLRQQQTPNNNLNLTGFSRGAVTCIRIANELKKLEFDLVLYQDDLELLEKLQNLNIHIFAADPVAGISDKSVIESRVIPSNVKSYVAILQMDEMRRDFKPQDLTRTIIASPNTKVSMLPMYGNHSDSTKIKSNKTQSGAKLTWYALHQFLTEHGTTFNNDVIPQIVSSQMEFNDLAQNPTPTQLLKIFSDYHSERNDYLKSGKKVKLHDGIPVARKQRSLNKHLKYYVKNPEFFVNQLERELFKVSYPQVFNYLFEKNIDDPRFPHAENGLDEHKTEVVNQLGDLKETNPLLFERLHNLGVSESELSQINIESPHGVHCLEPLTTLNQMAPNLIADEFLIANREIVSLSKLEKDVYHLTFRYEREKSDLSPYLARSRSTLAKKLRAQVKNIVEQPLIDFGELQEPEISQVKQQQILNLLEKNYIDLIKSSHPSQLRSLLERTLKKYNHTYNIEYQDSILRSIMSGTVDLLLSFIKEVVGFAFNLGYVGGAVLGVVGTLIEDLGQRLETAFFDYGSNIALNVIKTPFLIVCKMLQGVGFAIKHSLGLKPLAKFLDDGIRFLRDSMISAIKGTTVEKIAHNDPFLEAVDEIQDLNEAPEINHEVEDRFRLAKQQMVNIIHRENDEYIEENIDNKVDNKLRGTEI